MGLCCHTSSPYAKGQFCAWEYVIGKATGLKHSR